MATTFQWRRCDSSGANCADIGGATASAYTLTPADTGSVRVVADGATSAPWFPTPVLPGGYYNYAPLDGSIAFPWLQSIQAVNCGPTEGSISWIPGVTGQAARLHTPASAQPSTTCANSVALYLNGNYAGNPVHAGEGESTWYRVKWRDSSANVQAGEFNWIKVWHNVAATVPGTFSMAWGTWTANSASPTVPGTSPQIMFRSAGGANTAPVYNRWFTPLTLNHWYDLVAHIVWGVDAASGHVDAWVDGIPLVNANVPTLFYNSSSGARDQPGLGIYNYHYNVTWDQDMDYDELYIGPTAASIGFTP